MMKILLFLMLVTINLLLVGCFHTEKVSLNDLSAPIVIGRNADGKQIILPSPGNDPVANKRETKSVKLTKQPEVKASSSPVNAKVPPVKSFPPQAQPQNNIPPPKVRQHRGPEMWRAYSRLPQQEQQKLLVLQRTDPGKYWAAMQENAQRFHEQQRAKRQQLDNLTVQFYNTQNPAEKEQLKKDIRSLLKEDFEQRLQDTRRDIEATRRRTSELEKELEVREKNFDAIIDALLNKRLTAEK